MNVFNKFDTLIEELISEQSNTNSRAGGSQRFNTSSTDRQKIPTQYLWELDEYKDNQIRG